MPISAAGHIFALCPIVEYGVKLSLLMRPLHLLPGGGGGGQWEQVGQHKHDKDKYPWLGLGGGFLQGYAVLPGPLILVSLKQDRAFFTLAPGSRDWTPVLTDETRPPRDYVPILGRGVYMEQDNAIYMLRGNTIYAYKLSYIHQDQGDDDDQGRLDPPITIDSVCPYNSCDAWVWLPHPTRLDGRLMCSVWISLAPRQQLEECRCDNLHAIVTTFNLQDPAQGGIEVLHAFLFPPGRHGAQSRGPGILLSTGVRGQGLSGAAATPRRAREGSNQHAVPSSTSTNPPRCLIVAESFSKWKTVHAFAFAAASTGHVARECSLPPQEPSPHAGWPCFNATPSPF